MRSRFPHAGSPGTVRDTERFQVPVTFRNPGDGGIHEVVVVQDIADAESIWRARKLDDRILVVLSDTPETQTFQTRWFSGSGEIELCGSGACAAAQVIFACLGAREDDVTIRGRFYDIAASAGGSAMRIRLPRFPTDAYTATEELLKTLPLGAPAGWFVSQSLRTVVAQLPLGTDLASIVPDFTALRAVDDECMRALIITTADEVRGTFDYRYFTPWHGLDESPVAVSAIAVLGPFWCARLGRSQLIGHQCTNSSPRFQVNVQPDGTWVDFIPATLPSL